MINNKIFILIMIVLTGCNAQHLDLDKIDFNKKPSFENFKLSKVRIQKGAWVFEKTGHMPVLKGDLESTHYYFHTDEELDLLRFNELPIDDIGAKLVEYNNKLVYARFSLNYNKTFEVFKHLKQKLGMPDYQAYKTIVFHKNDPMVKLLLDNLTKDDGLKKTVNEFDTEVLTYPYRNVWVKDNLIYQYTLGQGRSRFNNRITIISKEATKKKIIFGYHNLECDECDPIFKKILN